MDNLLQKIYILSVKSLSTIALILLSYTLHYGHNILVNVYHAHMNLLRSGPVDSSSDSFLVKAHIVDYAICQTKLYNFFGW